MKKLMREATLGHEVWPLFKQRRFLAPSTLLHLELMGKQNVNESEERAQGTKLLRERGCIYAILEGD